MFSSGTVQLQDEPPCPVRCSHLSYEWHKLWLAALHWRCIPYYYTCIAIHVVTSLVHQDLHILCLCVCDVCVVLCACMCACVCWTTWMLSLVFVVSSIDVSLIEVCM